MVFNATLQQNLSIARPKASSEEMKEVRDLSWPDSVSYRLRSCEPDFFINSLLHRSEEQVYDLFVLYFYELTCYSEFFNTLLCMAEILCNPFEVKQTWGCMALTKAVC